MILIIGGATDEHVAPVAAELRRRGQQVATFDLSELPDRTRVSVAMEPGEGLRAVVDRGPDSFDLDDVETIWLRRIGTPQPPREVRDSWFAVAECHHLLVGLAQTLDERYWVNPLGALALDGGWGKIRQLDAARRIGLEVPRTLATNDPGRARAFVASCSGGAIYKAFACPNGLFTTDVTNRDPADFGSVRRAPCVFQERIPKRSDLRVTIMGDQVFACEISSQSLDESRVDYRRRCFALPRAKHGLPDEVTHRLVGLLGDLGLVFGTLDLAITPDGRYVFFEVNQQGCFLDVGATPGVDLLGAFCDFLS